MRKPEQWLLFVVTMATAAYVRQVAAAKPLLPNQELDSVSTGRDRGVLEIESSGGLHGNVLSSIDGGVERKKRKTGKSIQGTRDWSYGITRACSPVLYRRF